MLRPTVPLLVVLFVLGSALPLAAAPSRMGPGASQTSAAPADDGAASSFHALGCYADPAGDTAPAQADLVEVCARYFEANGPTPAAIVVRFDAAADLDPLGDAAWTNPGTAAALGLSLDGDDEVDRIFTITREDDGLVGAVADADGEAVDGCAAIAQVASGFLRGQFDAACIDGVATVRVVGTLAYEATAGAAVSVDRAPDGALSAPLPQGDESPVCANATSEAGTTLTIRRVACGGAIAGTEPISQAVATSQFVFDDPATPAIDPYTADFVVLARDDDFADALAGSSLSFGQGPLLFTYSPVSTPVDRDPGQLADITLAEILRVLPRGRTVYLLGGEAALAPGLVSQLEGLGYVVQRFAGSGREATARLVAAEVSAVVDEFAAATGFIKPNMVLIVNRANWPDAVLAGSLGAFWGMPILLTDANGPAHAETMAALDELRPDYINVIGGRSVVSIDTFLSIYDRAESGGYGNGRPGEDVTTPGTTWVNFCAYEARPGGGVQAEYMCRWGGDTRILTGAAIGQFNRDMVGRFADQPFIPANQQQYAVAVNLSGDVDSPNFATVLSAATVSGRFGGAVFIPTADQTIDPGIRNTLCNTPGAEQFIEQVEQVVLVGDTDLLGDAFAQQVRTLVEGGC